MDDCRGCCLGALLIPLLCCVLVAGAVIFIYTQSPEPPVSENFKPSTAEAQAFESSITAATNLARNQGWFYLTFNERQLSSWMAQRGDDFAEQHGHNYPFENVQIGIKDGKFTFYGDVVGYGPRMPLEVIITPKVDAEEHLELDIDEAHLGALSVPQFVLNNITAQVEDTLLQPIMALESNYKIFEPSLSLENGVFVVQGQVVR